METTGAWGSRWHYCRSCGVDISRGHWGLLLGMRCDDCIRAVDTQVEALRLDAVADEVSDREAMWGML